MICVVLCSKKLGINPDNVATPVAASLGDLTTLALLAALSKLVFMVVEGEIQSIISMVICVCARVYLLYSVYLFVCYSCW